MASAREDMQPADMQQRMQVGFLLVCSFSAIATNSSRSMMGPSFQVFDGRGGGLTRGDLAVIDDGGRDAAGADAAGGEERNLVVRGRFAGFDFQGVLNGRQHTLGP